jgi:hypothetical protein
LKKQSHSDRLEEPVPSTMCVVRLQGRYHVLPRGVSPPWIVGRRKLFVFLDERSHVNNLSKPLFTLRFLYWEMCCSADKYCD